MRKIYVLSIIQEKRWVKSGTASEGGTSDVDGMENKCNRKLNSNPGNLREQNSFVPENTAPKARQQWCKMQKETEDINWDDEKH